MSVSPLRVVIDDVPAPTHVTVPPGARHAYMDLKGRMAALDRIMAGPSATATAYAEIGRIADEIRTAAERVKRFSR